MSTRTKPFHYIILLLIVAGAALLRIQYNTVTLIDTPIRGDATSYVNYANNLVEHTTFSRSRESTPPVPDNYWAPGYPAFLAAVIVTANTIEQDSYTLTLQLQAILGAATVLLVFLFARLVMSTAWALFAAALMSISPHAVSLGSYLLTETLFAFLLTLALLLFALSVRSLNPKTEIAAGLVFGACYLVNPVSLLVAPFALAAIALFTIKKDKRGNIVLQRVGASLRIMLPLLAIVGIWGIRSVLNVPDGAQTSGSRLLGNLIIGLFSDFHETWRADPRDPSNPATLAAARIGGSYTELFNEFWELFKENPGHMLKWYAVDKPILLWDWNIRIGQGDIFVFPVVYSLYHVSSLALATYSVMHVTHDWVLLLGLVALIVVWHEKTEARYTMIVLLTAAWCCSAVYIITQAEPRYSIPLRPLLYIAATYTLSRIAEKTNALRLYQRAVIEDQPAKKLKSKPGYWT